MTTHSLTTKLLSVWPKEMWQEQTIVLAVSGGADSVALLRAIVSLARSNEHLHVAHFNHGWRGNESDEDERFVSQLSESLGVGCTVARNQAHEENSRSEQTARTLRYRFLQQVAHQQAAKFILTAHTASDRVETMLHNLCRGTGLGGVSSPTLKRKIGDKQTLVRPMLHCFRDEVVDYLNQLQQPFREDSSNRNEAYRRNFLRQTILPQLREVYGNKLDQRLFSFSQLAEESLDWQRQQANRYQYDAERLEAEFVAKGLLTSSCEQQLRIPCEKLLPNAWPIVLLAIQQAWHLLDWKQQAMTRAHWEKLRNAWERLNRPKERNSSRTTLKREKSLFHLPQGIEVTSLNGWLILRTGAP